MINYSKKPGGWITWLHDDTCSRIRNMIFHINYPSILFLDPGRFFYYYFLLGKWFYFYFLLDLFSFTLSNYKQPGLLNKSSLLAGQRFANLSSCQVVIGTDPTLVPLTSAKHDGPVWALCCNLAPLRVNSPEFECMLRFTRKDETLPPSLYSTPSPCSRRAIDFPSKPLMDGWHYFYHCNIISPCGLCLCGV